MRACQSMRKVKRTSGCLKFRKILQSASMRQEGTLLLEHSDHKIAPATFIQDSISPARKD